MIRFKNVYALVAMVTVIIIVQTPNLFGQSRSNSGKSAYGLEKHLEEWGEEFDCYFTIEDQSFVIGNSIVSSKINKMEPFEAIQGITDIDSLVGQLKRMLPFAEVRREESNTAVIHIIEKQLLKVKGYPLDIQKDLQYSGNAKEFIDILEGISPNRKIAFQMYSSSYGSNAERDKKFRLQIDSKGKTVRNLLTNWLHLPEMNRILWKIQTWDTKKGLESKLIYNQPVCLVRDTVFYPEYGLLSLDSDTDSPERGNPSDFLSFSTDPVQLFITHAKMPPGKSFKFSDGQVAWAFNNDEPRVHQKAMDYIEKHAGEGVSSQVRWSMLYLSKHKDLTAIPLLIKHIDELYSPVPVRETAYPAVEALTALGIPAAKAAEIALKKETDSKRIELLSWTILKVYGREVGVKRLNAVLEDSGTDDLVKRLKLTTTIESLNNELLLFERLAAETKQAKSE